jgi:molybdate transport system permease protein
LPFILLGLSLLVLFSSDFGKWMKEAGIQVIFSPLGIIAAQTL